MTQMFQAYKIIFVAKYVFQNNNFFFTKHLNLPLLSKTFSGDVPNGDLIAFFSSSSLSNFFSF